VIATQRPPARSSQSASPAHPSQTQAPRVEGEGTGGRTGEQSRTVAMRQRHRANAPSVCCAEQAAAPSGAALSATASAALDAGAGAGASVAAGPQRDASARKAAVPRRRMCAKIHRFVAG
jgi:hypothetical protein